MQSGLGKSKSWVLEFVSKKSGVNPLMGWESSTHTLSEVKLEFTNKENAIKYAKKNKLDYEVIEPKIKKITKKKIESCISNLNKRYADRAIHIKQVASGYRFQAKTGLEAYISKLKDKGTNRFSKAFLETTAIIAYKQPVTRGDIEDIRGISVSYTHLRAHET